MSYKPYDYAISTFSSMAKICSRSVLLTTYKPLLMANKDNLIPILRAIKKKFTRKVSVKEDDDNELPTKEHHVSEDKETEGYTYKLNNDVTWPDIYDYLLKKQHRMKKKKIVYTPENLECFRQHILEGLFNNNIQECFDYSMKLFDI